MTQSLLTDYMKMTNIICLSMSMLYTLKGQNNEKSVETLRYISNEFRYTSCLECEFLH